MAREEYGPDPCKGCHALVETVEGTGMCRSCLDAERAAARAHGVDIAADQVRTCTLTYIKRSRP